MLQFHSAVIAIKLNLHLAVHFNLLATIPAVVYLMGPETTILK